MQSTVYNINTASWMESWRPKCDSERKLAGDQEVEKQPNSSHELGFHSCFVTQCLPNKFGLKVENFQPKYYSGAFVPSDFLFQRKLAHNAWIWTKS